MTETGMGDVLELRRPFRAEVRRFGQTFKAELRVGATPRESDPQAPLYVGDTLMAWASVEYLSGNWAGLVLSIEDDQCLIEPGVLGMATMTEDELDAEFILDTEDYVITLLRDELVRLLVAHFGAEEANALTETQSRVLTPRERAQRVVRLWHDYGRVEKDLPDLVAIEIFSVAEDLGMAVVAGLEDWDGEASTPQGIVQEVIDGVLGQWEQANDAIG